MREVIECLRTAANSNLSCFLDVTDVQYTERFCHKSMYSGCFQSCLGNMHLNCDRWRVLYHTHRSSRKTRDAPVKTLPFIPSILQCVVLSFYLTSADFVGKSVSRVTGHQDECISPDALNEKKRSSHCIIAFGILRYKSIALNYYSLLLSLKLLLRWRCCYFEESVLEDGRDQIFHALKNTGNITGIRSTTF